MNPISRFIRKHIIAEAPASMGRTSVLDLSGGYPAGRSAGPLMPPPASITRIKSHAVVDASADIAALRECAVDVPDIAEPTGLDIARHHLRSLHTHLHDLGELTDEQYQALASMADGSTWTPPAPPSHETRPLPRREPIDVTDSLTPGGKALARQRTERMIALAHAVDAAPEVPAERAAAAEAYRSILRVRIDAERTAREHGRSARRTGSDTHALTAAFAMLDRRDLAADTRAHLAAIILAEYTGVAA